MADHDPRKDSGKHNAPIQHPRIAVGLLATTAVVSTVSIVVNLGRDSIAAIAATLGIASALTLVAFMSRNGRP